VKKVVLIGGNGFVGQNFQKLIPAEFACIHVLPDEPLNLNCDIVIHLAAIADTRKKDITYKEYFEVNANLAIKVFDAFLVSSARKFIFLSSAKAITEFSSTVITEEFMEQPQTFYGRSKLAADRYISNCVLPPDKQVYILRPPLITGYCAKGNLKVFNRFSQGPLGWLFLAFTSLRSFCNIKNLAFVADQLINRTDIPSGTYLIADDTPLSAADLHRIFSKGKKPLFFDFLKRISLLFVWFVKVFASLLNIRRVNDYLMTLNGTYVVSNKKIVDAIGLPLPFSSEEGVQSFVKE
jgi:nucleoside-diphosphate-sugar epimerase